MPAEAVGRLVDVGEVQGDREVDERTSGLILASVRIKVDVSDRINHPVTWQQKQNCNFLFNFGPLKVSLKYALIPGLTSNSCYRF